MDDKSEIVSLFTRQVLMSSRIQMMTSTHEQLFSCPLGGRGWDER
jgi:hypothetical protein